MTQKQWDNSQKGTYAMYADTYAMILYKLGKHKKVFPKQKMLPLLSGKEKRWEQYLQPACRKSIAG